MTDVKDWTAEAKNMLKAELKRRGVSYSQLAERLNASGAKENDANLRNKISRGGFTASFFLQCLTAIGCERLELR